MIPFLFFLAGFAAGGVTFALFAKDVFKKTAKTKQIIVIHPDGDQEPRVETRSE